MAAQVRVLGVRHHGPGSARMVLRALKKLKADAVLIEGPPDAADVLPMAAHADMKPPVALLVYEPDCPSEAVYYPFAKFSPEWQAIRWALETKAEVRLIDLPQALRPRRGKQDRRVTEKEDIPPGVDQGGEAKEDDKERSCDPLEALAQAAGFADGEQWWGRLIEERHGDEDPLGVFDSIRDAMATARHELGPTRHDPEEPSREAHMRRAIRKAIKEGYQRIAVVCGAWHAPVLTEEALAQIAVKDDETQLKGLTARKTTATWIPWTYDRLSAFSGYGAGVVSPGWYEHLWVHHKDYSESWLTKVARLMRSEDLDASPASVIESVRLADTLASLRGRSMAGLDELGEATLSILCHGNPMPLRVIERKLIVGSRLGEVPEGAPTVPLQRDLAAQQKSLRLKASPEETLLDLDQRKELDLARSRFLHRLTILNIQWGELGHDQRQRASTFHEVWNLRWRPEFAVSVMEAARWGNTVYEAAAAYAADKAAHGTGLADLTSLLDHVMLADLPTAVERLVVRLQELSAVAADIGLLMEAMPPLARVLRYGNVRKTDAALVEPVVAGLLARVCAGLLPACGSLDDDAAQVMKSRIDGVHAALSMLDRGDFLGPWKQELRKLGEGDFHGLVCGRSWRILLDSGAVESDEAAKSVSLALSAGNDPGKASAWLEGFLGGSGMILIHDERLLGIIDQWITSLTQEIFERVCPIARRTFSTFSTPERRQLGEKLRRVSAPVAALPVASADYDAERGALVVPLIRLILGDRLK